MPFINYHSDQHPVSQWSGGSTTQLYIFPGNASLDQRNFDLRLSTATIEVEESLFTKLIGYERKIMVLSGDLEISHANKEPILLKTFEQHNFSGDWDTKSKGKVIDFNVIYKPELLLEMFHVSLKQGETYSIDSNKTQFMYLYRGAGTIIETAIYEGDLVELLNPESIFFKAEENSDLVIVEWKN